MLPLRSAVLSGFVGVMRRDSLVAGVVSFLHEGKPGVRR
jgi:hypothetical protein